MENLEIYKFGGKDCLEDWSKYNYQPDSYTSVIPSLLVNKTVISKRKYHIFILINGFNRYHKSTNNKIVLKNGLNLRGKNLGKEHLSTSIFEIPTEFSYTCTNGLFLNVLQINWPLCCNV